MRTVIVQATDGEVWRVRVVWEPRWRALARRFGGWRRRRRPDKGSPVGGPDIDPPGGVPGGGHHGGVSGGGGGHHGGGGGGGGWDLGDDILAGIAVIVGMIVVGALFWWLLLPLLLLVLDVVVVAVLVVAGVAGRVLFRRPWTVRAIGPPGAEVAAGVVGWRAALRTRDEIAGKLRLGHRPEEAIGAARERIDPPPRLRSAGLRAAGSDR